MAGIRGMIARRMHESLRDTAQLSFFADADAEALVAARAAWRAAGVKIGYEDLVIAALARVLPAFPLFNAHEGEGGVAPSAAINVGVAIALPGALVAPCLFDCAAKDVAAIAAERADLAARAPANKLTVKEMSGATFTVSNLGTTRVRHFTPIAARPTTAMLGLGRIAEMPVVRDGAVVARRMLGLSLTVDHRAIDGQPAGDFLTALCEALEGPQPSPPQPIPEG